jgi:hypothetical protein
MRNAARAAYSAVLNALPDRLAVSLLHYRMVGSWPNLDRPQTFNEKIQYRKLTDRDLRLPIMADKIAVKGVVSDRLGAGWITPTLWSGDRLEPAALDQTGPVVLKSSHGSRQIAFIDNPADADFAALQRQSDKWLAEPYAKHAREWLYSRITPRLLVEPFIGEAGTPPDDYKLYVFAGRVHYIQVDTGRFAEHRRAFFDRDWNRQPFTSAFPAEVRPLARPRSLAAMIEGAEALGRDFPFVRIDLYEIAGRPRFGEATFYPESGGGRFDPPEYDAKLGALWP